MRLQAAATRFLCKNFTNLPWWQVGKNHNVHTPENRLAEFEKAVKGGKRAKDLLMEPSRCNLQSVLAADATSEKSTRHGFEVVAGPEAIATAAPNSIAKDEIECTAQLEHVMNKAAAGI